MSAGQKHGLRSELDSLRQDLREESCLPSHVPTRAAWALTCIAISCVLLSQMVREEEFVVPVTDLAPPPITSWWETDGAAAVTVPLPSLKDRVPFADPDFGDCEPFTVPNGRVYGKLNPSPANHVGTVVPGRVYVRCNRGFELKLETSPERRCNSRQTGAPSWLPSDSDWTDSICVAAAPAMLARTATFDQHQHLQCFERLVKSSPRPGSPQNDHRAAALECLGCRRVPGSVDNDCSESGRLFELADVDCTRPATLGGGLGGGTYCVLPRILSQPDPCVVLTVGVGFVWGVEYDLTMRWNCTTYMFDPTPGSGLGQPKSKIPLSYHRQYDLSTQHRPFGNWMEWSGINPTDEETKMKGSAQFGQSKGAVSFLTVGTMLNRIGHTDGRRIALFKLDVEGYEFGVLDQVLEQHFSYINIDFHTWDHVKLSNALHAFAAAGYRIMGIDTARVDDRPTYGMLIHMEFALVEAPATSAAAQKPCADSDAVQCPLWAARGDCGTNSAWMKEHCRASCGVCSP